jgi:hypothetical protein
LHTRTRLQSTGAQIDVHYGQIYIPQRVTQQAKSFVKAIVFWAILCFPYRLPLCVAIMLHLLRKGRARLWKSVADDRKLYLSTSRSSPAGTWGRLLAPY